MATVESKTPTATNKSFEVIGVSGRAGSGKDYVALQMLFKSFAPLRPTLIVCFADLIKLLVVVFDKLDFDKVYGDKRDETTRLTLQRRGTEQGRDKYGRDVWVRALNCVLQMYAMRGIQLFIVSDVRFKNEVEAIHQLGGIVVRLESPKRSWSRALHEANGDESRARTIQSHASETDLDNYRGFNVTIPNDMGQETLCAQQVHQLIIKPRLLQWGVAPPHDPRAMTVEDKRRIAGRGL